MSDNLAAECVNCHGYRQMQCKAVFKATGNHVDRIVHVTSNMVESAGIASSLDTAQDFRRDTNKYLQDKLDEIGCTLLAHEVELRLDQAVCNVTRL